MFDIGPSAFGFVAHFGALEVKGHRKATHHFVDTVSSCLALTPYLEQFPWPFLSFDGCCECSVASGTFISTVSAFFAQHRPSTSRMFHSQNTPPPSHQTPVYFHSEDSYLLFM